MKKQAFILLLLAITVLYTYAQDDTYRQIMGDKKVHSRGICNLPLNNTDEVEYTKINIVSTDQTNTYSAMRLWAIKTYPDYKMRVQIEDAVNYKIIINGYQKDICYRETESAKQWFDLSYTLTLEAKEGKYRYRMDNFKLIEFSSFNELGGNYEGITYELEVGLAKFKGEQLNCVCSGVSRAVDNLIGSLTKALKVTKQDNW